MLRYCNFSKALSWDVVGFLSVVAVTVYSDYLGLFGLIRMYRRCLRMIKGEFQICCKFNSGFHHQLSQGFCIIFVLK